MYSDYVDKLKDTIKDGELLDSEIQNLINQKFIEDGEYQIFALAVEFVKLQLETEKLKDKVENLRYTF